MNLWIHLVKPPFSEIDFYWENAPYEKRYLTSLLLYGYQIKSISPKYRLSFSFVDTHP